MCSSRRTVHEIECRVNDVMDLSTMKTPRLAIALTVTNLVLLLLSAGFTGRASSQTVEPVLRGRSLELVSDDGVIRTRLEVKPDGTVLLQLFDENGIGRGGARLRAVPGRRVERDRHPARGKPEPPAGPAGHHAHPGERRARRAADHALSPRAALLAAVTSSR
jgi:hypothetical protein